MISATLSLTSDSKQSGKGSLIGYSDLGLPLYSFKNSVLHQTSKSFLNLGSAIFKQMLTNPNSRKIFYFLCVNMGKFSPVWYYAIVFIKLQLYNSIHCGGIRVWSVDQQSWINFWRISYAFWLLCSHNGVDCFCDGNQETIKNIFLWVWLQHLLLIFF